MEEKFNQITAEEDMDDDDDDSGSDFYAEEDIDDYTPISPESNQKKGGFKSSASKLAYPTPTQKPTGVAQAKKEKKGQPKIKNVSQAYLRNIPKKVQCRLTKEEIEKHKAKMAKKHHIASSENNKADKEQLHSNSIGYIDQIRANKPDYANVKSRVGSIREPSQTLRKQNTGGKEKAKPKLVEQKNSKLNRTQKISQSTTRKIVTGVGAGIQLKKPTRGKRVSSVSNGGDSEGYKSKEERDKKQNRSMLHKPKVFLNS